MCANVDNTYGMRVWEGARGADEICGSGRTARFYFALLACLQLSFLLPTPAAVAPLIHKFTQPPPMPDDGSNNEHTRRVVRQCPDGKLALSPAVNRPLNLVGDH
jgi:hypothetical protein